LLKQSRIHAARLWILTHTKSIPVEVQGGPSICTQKAVILTFVPVIVELSHIRGDDSAVFGLLCEFSCDTRSALHLHHHFNITATAHIAFHLTNYVEHNYAGTQNLLGDEQLELDIHCDDAVFAVRESGVYSTVASEETPVETTIGMAPSLWLAIHLMDH